MDNPTAAPGQAWCQQLYESLAAELILYGRALGLGHGEAEDVLHDTFAALLQLSRPPENPRHYCLRTFRHRAFNHHRSLWRRLARNWECTRWFEPPTPDSPAETAALRELQTLPPEQREAVVLKIWHGLTFEEIGSLQACSPNTAAGRYRYALQKLRTCIESNSYEYHEASGRSFVHLATPPTFPAP